MVGRVISRDAIISSIRLLIILVPLTLAAAFISPLVREKSISEREFSSPRFLSMREGFIRDSNRDPEAGESVYYTNNLSPLLNMRAGVESLVGEDGLFYRNAFDIEVRWERIIALTSIVILTFTVVSYLVREQRDDERKRDRLSELFDLNRRSQASAVDFMIYDVRTAFDSAQSLLLRSNILLIGGILMSFIGVGAFFMSLTSFYSPTLSPEIVSAQNVSTPSRIQTDPGGDGDWVSEEFIMITIKSTGVLIFLEAIAWFLLRQYRAIIEDYKYFYRIYLRRINYLVALKIIDGKAKKDNSTVVTALLREDLKGKLIIGETTESIEAMKALESGPVADILDTVKEYIKRPSSVKAVPAE